jgi:quercetin dioxygenase-like cupin family protein
MPQAFYIIDPGEGQRHEARGSVMHFKATAATTKGRFSLMERTLPPGGRMTPAHTHTGDEGFYVLDGSITFVLDSKEHAEGPGTFVLVPEGTGHTFGNTSTQPARLLIIHAPATDAYFAELEQLWSGTTPPTIEQERALQARHGMRPA